MSQDAYLPNPSRIFWIWQRMCGPERQLGPSIYTATVTLGCSKCCYDLLSEWLKALLWLHRCSGLSSLWGYRWMARPHVEKDSLSRRLAHRRANAEDFGSATSDGSPPRDWAILMSQCLTSKCEFRHCQAAEGWMDWPVSVWEGSLQEIGTSSRNNHTETFWRRLAQRDSCTYSIRGSWFYTRWTRSQQHQSFRRHIAESTWKGFPRSSKEWRGIWRTKTGQFLALRKRKYRDLGSRGCFFPKENWGTIAFGGLRLSGQCWLRVEKIQRHQKPKPSFIACSISTGADLWTRKETHIQCLNPVESNVPEHVQTFSRHTIRAQNDSTISELYTYFRRHYISVGTLAIPIIDRPITYGPYRRVP